MLSFKSKYIEIVPEETLHTFTVFPDDLNYAGTLFGGKLLSEMDIAALKAVRRVLYKSPCDGAVTASVDKVDFEAPGRLGDIIDLKAVVKHLGKSSIVVGVVVTKEDQKGRIERICTAKFTFVALKKHKPHPHHCLLGLN